jgi:hypothetical protein
MINANTGTYRINTYDQLEGVGDPLTRTGMPQLRVVRELTIDFFFVG